VSEKGLLAGTTPGPWVWDETGSLTGEEGERVLLVRDVDAVTDEDRALVARAPDLARANTELRALLEEWVTVPFFKDQREWNAWVAEFRPRVEAALEEEP